MTIERSVRRRRAAAQRRTVNFAVTGAEVLPPATVTARTAYAPAGSRRRPMRPLNATASGPDRSVWCRVVTVASLRHGVSCWWARRRRGGATQRRPYHYL